MIAGTKTEPPENMSQHLVEVILLPVRYIGICAPGTLVVIKLMPAKSAPPRPQGRGLRVKVVFDENRKGDGQSKKGRPQQRTVLPFLAHPHMLRHACGFALANQGANSLAYEQKARRGNP